MLQIWFKIFYRNQKKNWLNIIINVLGLTLSLSVLLLVLLYLRDEQKYNETNPNRENIYRVVHKMSDGDIWGTSTDPEGEKYVEDLPEITHAYLSDSWYSSKLIEIDQKKHYKDRVLRGEPSFFHFFPFKILEGSVEKFEETRQHVAVSTKLAKELFGAVSPIGKTIDIEGKSYSITTLYEATGKHFFKPDLVMQFNKKPGDEWGNYSRTLFIKTVKDINVKDLEEKMNGIWYKYQTVPQAKADGMDEKEWNEKYGTTVLLERLKDIRLQTYARFSGPHGKGNYQFIMIMFSLAVLLLVISCVNFINLSIASASQRAKEVGVKKTLGLSKFMLKYQFTMEIVIQGILAFILALIVVELFLPSFNDFQNKKIVLFEEIGIIAKIFGVAILVSLFIGYIPSLYTSKFKAVEVLKGNIARSKKGILARNIMLGLQFLISGFFLASSMIIYNQVNYMMTKDLGFSGEQMVILTMKNYKSDRYQKYQLAKNELAKHPNITAVTSNFFIPNGGYANSTNTTYKENISQANGNALEFGYLDLIDVELLKGRHLKPELASDTISNILVNETMAKQLGIYNDPIGKEISLGYGGVEGNKDGKYTIIGLVKDYHMYGFNRKIPPTFYFHWNTIDWMRKFNFYNIQIKIKPENIQETLAYVEDYWKQHVEQDYPFDYQFMDKQFEASFIKYQKEKTIFTSLTFIVILISLLGLFALATLTIQQRLKEVAIRKTLGASVKEIMYQLIKSFLKITLIASVVLIPIVYYFMRNWLNDFAFRIEMPILPYIITPLVLSILVFTVVGLKAYNATKIDLIKYLKFE